MNDEAARGDFLVVEGLSKSFPGILANDGVSLRVRRGEIHCLLGENGAGKTTLAECLYGAYRPDSGRILIDGEPVELSSPREAIARGIGMVHQHFMLVTPMTVLENIAVGSGDGGVLLNLRRAAARVEALCASYGIRLRLDAVVADLSVGEQQWVEILKSLYLGVRFLILDEPTAVLTPQEIESFFAILGKMKADGLSIILITHKLNEVMQISDRVSVLRRGRLVDTVNTGDVTKADLARMMVGREVLFRTVKEQIPAGEPVLELRDVRLEADTHRLPLQGIRLEVRKAEILGIAGVAGNGQRELFDAIVGTAALSGGRVLLLGEDLARLGPRARLSRGIASIPEDRIREGSLLDFSIAENLVLGNHRRPAFRTAGLLDARRLRRFARDKIREFDIAATSAEQRARLLSGGNLQKVILARELSMQPVFLVASQPTRGLDVGATEYVHRCLLGLRAAGCAILLISNELEEIFSLSDRIAVMYKGSIRGVLDAGRADVHRVGLLMAGVDAEVEVS